MTKTISFSGTVIDGVGKHETLRVPGRSEISQAPPDWPEELCPGSLNLKVAPCGYPKNFEVLGLPHSTRSLDSGTLAPCFEIAQHEFGNNLIEPTVQMPERGTAQVWRAKLEYGPKEIDCWVLRRYGSGLADQIEILSSEHLRGTYGIISGNRAKITLLSDSGDV